MPREISEAEIKMNETAQKLSLLMIITQKYWIDLADNLSITEEWKICICIENKLKCRIFETLISEISKILWYMVFQKTKIENRKFIDLIEE